MKIKCYQLKKKNNELTLVKDGYFEYKNDAVLSSPSQVADAIRNILDYENEVEEKFYCVCMNARGNVIGVCEISHGGSASSVANLQGLFRRLLLIPDCANFLVVHNHPSGAVKPSEADIDTTKKIKEASRLFELNFLDHIIIGEDDYFSFKNNGLVF